MDSSRFDQLLRALASGGTRRAALSTLASSLFAAGALTTVASDAEAKKGKKKKKKCKGGKKKCGRKCIAATACCSSADCGANGTCVSGTCNCAAGFKSCNGRCIASDACCDDCPGDKVCIDGSCSCPEDAPFECQGDVCVAGSACCGDAECVAGQTCQNGFCACDLDEITCGGECCTPATQTCNGNGGGTCETGTCSAFPNDWCNGSDFYLCANNGVDTCACVSTVDGPTATACVDYFATINPVSCAPCTTSDNCGPNEVCIAGNNGTGGEFCGCSNNFCVPECGASVLRGARSGANASLVTEKGDAPKRTSRARRRRR